jgi:hypothetical protein
MARAAKLQTRNLESAKTAGRTEYLRSGSNDASKSLEVCPDPSERRENEAGPTSSCGLSLYVYTLRHCMYRGALTGQL